MTEEDYSDTFSNTKVLRKYRTKNDVVHALSREIVSKQEIVSIKDVLQITVQKPAQNREVSSVFYGPENRFYELLDYQVYIKEQILNIVNSSNRVNKVIVHMPTGTGKTKTSMHTIIEYWQNIMKCSGLVIWIAHTNTLLEQAEETFYDCWTKLGVGSINVYRQYDTYSNDSVQTNMNGIVFIGIQRMIMMLKNNDTMFELLAKQTRIIFFDEAHKSTAVATQKALKHLLKLSDPSENKKSLVGLTATPGRNSGDDFSNTVLAEMYDRNMISIDPEVIEQLRKNKLQALNQRFTQTDIVHYFQDRKILSKLQREEITYETKSLDQEIEQMKVASDGDDLPYEVIKRFSFNLERNKRIISKLLELANGKVQTIFFACTVEHGKFITSYLKANGISVGEVYGETSTEERLDIIRRFRNSEINIIINCGVLTTGFDSTNIRCVFIARPTTSVVLYSQMIGRGLRGPKMGGGEYCKLIDMKDNLTRFSNENMTFAYFNDYWR